MNVCFVSHSAGLAGAERSLLETVAQMQRRGVQCIVVVPGRGPLADEFERSGIRVAILHYTWWIGPGRSAPVRAVKMALNTIAAVLLAVLLRLWRVDAVFTNAIASPVGAFAAALARIPHVWQPREFGWEDHGLTFDLGSRLSLSVVDRLSAACVVASDALATHYGRAIAPSKIRIVPQAVRQPRAGIVDADWRAKPFRFVIAGTLHDGKGQHEAIEAMALLVRDGVQVELAIVGSGAADYTKHLEGLVSQLGIGDHVTFVGQVPDAYTWFAGAQCVLVCSRNEAFGRVTIEGMMAGRPVIGTRSGATGQLIQGGSTGLLYERGDARDLAKQMGYIIANPDVAERMARAARRYALATFGTHRSGAMLLDVFNRVCGRSADPCDRGAA